MRPLTDDDPRHVGHYTLVGRLGSGAMGTVYLVAALAVAGRLLRGTAGLHGPPMAPHA